MYPWDGVAGFDSDPYSFVSPGCVKIHEFAYYLSYEFKKMLKKGKKQKTNVWQKILSKSKINK